MRKLIIGIIITACVTLVGCRVQQVVPQPVAVADTTVLPSFPAEVLYVLGARWEADTSLS